jgi:hypothetical protein
LPEARRGVGIGGHHSLAVKTKVARGAAHAVAVVFLFLAALLAGRV